MLDLTNTINNPGGASSTTRGIIAGGDASGGLQNVIQYVTIPSGGNATDFGDLIAAKYRHAGMSSSTLGIFGGGGIASGENNVIEFVTIASTGNSTDFGDLTAALAFVSAGCAGHSSVQPNLLSDLPSAGNMALH